MSYPIKVAARRSGLTPHVVRVWEKRYGAVRPARTATNRRMYDDVEIERLQLLRLATEAGHTIGQIATLPTTEIRAMVQTDSVQAPVEPANPGSHSSSSAAAGRHRDEVPYAPCGGDLPSGARHGRSQPENTQRAPSARGRPGYRSDTGGASSEAARVE